MIIIYLKYFLHIFLYVLMSVRSQDFYVCNLFEGDILLLYLN